MNFYICPKSKIGCTDSEIGNEMRIPFEVSIDPFYTPINQSVLEKSIQQLEAGKGKQHDIIEVDE